jgi:7-cyano-7-deazaguanine synthase
MTAKSVVMVSGGMDSTVLTYWMLHRGLEPTPVFFDYGQHCAATELSFARSVLPPSTASRLEVLTLGGIFSHSQSRLIVAADLWRDRVAAADIILPYRNLLLLAAGVAFAASANATSLYSAFINSNHATEIDATRSFLTSVSTLVQAVGSVKVEMPFRDLPKKDVAKLGVELGAPVDRTFSCQVNPYEHCGACPNCVDRLEALRHVA